MLDWILRRDEKIQELRAQLKEQVRREVKNELFNQLRAEMEVHLRPMVFEQLRREFWENQSAEIERELRQELRETHLEAWAYEIKAELANDIYNTQHALLADASGVLNDEIRRIAETKSAEIERQVRSQLRQKLIPEITAVLEGELRASLREQLAPEINAKLRQSLAPKVRASLKKELLEELKTAQQALLTNAACVLNDEIRRIAETRSPAIERQVRASLTRDLSETVKAEVIKNLQTDELLRSEVRSELRSHYEAELGPKLKKMVEAQAREAALKNIRTSDLGRQFEADVLRQHGPRIEKEIEAELRERITLELRAALEKSIAFDLKKQAVTSSAISQP